jgi:glycosyltransferase involved in cell wall biosynthesis
VNARPRILFVSHSASRNGASILLLHFLQWLKTRVDWDIEVLIDGRGPLVDDFKAVGRTHVLRNTDRLLVAFPERWRTRLRPLVKQWCVRAMFAGRRFDLIYANTIAAWPHVNALRSKAPSLVWHIHELRYVLQLEMTDDRARDLLRHATAFVAVSQSVRDTLAQEYAVPIEKVDLVHGFVPFPDLPPADKRTKRARILESLGWPGDAVVVGGCGSMGWRKGTDLFLQIADQATAADKYDRMRFLWVGGAVRDKDSLEFEDDLRARGLENRCVRIPAASDVLDYYCAMNIFALTSREDPFPLVMLEAAANGLPVVCFAASGGGPEFVGSDAGVVARYQDVSAFADHLKKLHDEPALREELGTAGFNKVRAHFTAMSQAPKLSTAITRHLPAHP